MVAVARRAERLAQLQTAMARTSPSSSYAVCDLADVGAFVDLLHRIADERGRIDILLNVAGTGGIERDAPATVQDARTTMEVNFFAPYAGMLAVLAGMRARRHGVVANMSSDDARAPGGGAGDYSASKAALSAATESISYEVRDDDVRLHVVYPGWVPTEMGLKAVREGGMRMPPRGVRRTEEHVSAVVLRRLGGPLVDINCARLPLVAPVLRTVAPRAYRTIRATR